MTTDSPQNKPKYDLAEAADLLIDASREVEVGGKATESAAQELLHVIAELNQTSVQFTLEPDRPDRLKLQLGNRCVWIEHVGDGRFRVASDKAGPDSANFFFVDGLRYNPFEKVIEGPLLTAKDDDAPRARRSAVAVLVKAALESWRTAIKVP